MLNTIPASSFVSVTPSVVSPGGTGVTLNGLYLTNGTRVPIGTVKTFARAADVAAFFGASSGEAARAAVYFSGFDNSQIKPGSLLFAQYNQAAVAGYLNGGNVAAALTLTQLQALTPATITISVDGTPHTSTSINLSTATSFSNAATLINTALGAGAVTFDSVSGGFVITSGTTGATSSVAFPTTNALATSLMLTQASGAYLSAGADAVASPAAMMNAVVATTQNWATFATTFDPDVSGNTNKVAFALWTSQQNNRYAYVVRDTDTTPTNTNPATTSLGQLLKTNNYSGTIPIWDSGDSFYAAFIMGAIASVDFTQTNGRATLAFKGQAGLAPTVTSATVASNLQANGYNYYGIAANANQSWNFMYPGSISGMFSWIDSYVDQIWLNSQLQAQLMTLLTQVRSIPYNSAGYSLIENAVIPTAQQGLDNGVIRAGVTLSALQQAEVNAAAGKTIAPVLATRGWYLMVNDAPATTRATRGSPPMTFWYVDGGSIQQINLSSVDVQ